MVQPINYSLNVQSPFEAALSGFKIGATIRDPWSIAGKPPLI